MATTGVDWRDFLLYLRSAYFRSGSLYYLLVEVLSLCAGNSIAWFDCNLDCGADYDRNLDSDLPLRRVALHSTWTPARQIARAGKKVAGWGRIFQLGPLR